MTLYMSVALLRSCGTVATVTSATKRAEIPKLKFLHPAHDPFDDLESFYYSFYEIINMHTGRGKRLNAPKGEALELLPLWANDDPVKSAVSKESHFFIGLVDIDQSIYPTWLEPSLTALEECFQVLSEIANEKKRLRKLDSDAKLNAIKQLDLKVGQYYRSVIASLDLATEKIRHMDEKDDQEDNSENDAETEVDVVHDKEGDDYNGMIALVEEEEEEESLDMRDGEAGGVEGVTGAASALELGPSLGTGLVYPATPANKANLAPSPWPRVKRRLDLEDIDSDDDDSNVDTPSKKDKRPRVL